MDDLRSEVAAELWRQIQEDFRNPPAIAAPADSPVVGSRDTERLLNQRADAILAIIARAEVPR